jgi:PAS domain-containing protein
MRTDTQSVDTFLRAVLDAVPSMVFIVDKDLTVLDANEAAHRTLGGNPQVVLKRLCGEVLHCLNVGLGKAGAGPKRCGTTEFCDSCVLRQSSKDAQSGVTVERRPYTMRLEKGGTDEEVHLLVTAKAFDAGGEPLTFLVLEDVTELVELQRLVPICAWCRKVRDDGEYKYNLETWLTKRTHLKFSHVMCPECSRTYGGE